MDNSKHYRREVASLLIPGADFISITTSNSPSYVEFDFFSTWEYWKKLDKKPDGIFMIHTHPPGLDVMSPIDKNQVFGWHKAFGVPIVYAIQQFNYINTCVYPPEDEIEYHSTEIDEIDETDLLPCVLRFLSYRKEDPTLEQIGILQELCQDSLRMELLSGESFTQTESNEEPPEPQMESTV